MNWSRLSPSSGAGSPGTKFTSDGETTQDDPAPWNPDIWHSLPSSQQPEWTAPGIGAVRESLFELPPLSAPADVRNLLAALREVRSGGRFLVQGGDCAEPFGLAAVAGARNKHGLLGRMATLISERVARPVVTVGRLAGQFGKPRSQPTEWVDGRQLPSFRGLMVNGAEPTDSARRPHAPRLLDAYRTAHRVFEELHQLSAETRHRDGRPAPATWWATAPPALSSGDNSYGSTTRHGAGWRHNGLWTSHEALVLDYEEPLTRKDPDTGEWFLTSTHLPWIGARTNRPDGAHVAFLSGVANPVACKIGPDVEPAELVRICDRLDPDRVPGRLTLISRQGALLIRERLPELARAVRRAGHPAIWMCDPMHGNTVRTASGLKTRHYDDIVDELRGFFEVLVELVEWPGGVHLELAGEDVTECVGGGGPDGSALETAYHSLCDPRLNDVQALSLAAEIAELLDAAAAALTGKASLLAVNN